MSKNGFPGRGFIIDSFPRTGSTTLARLLGCHAEIRCLMEPFHPKLHGGGFNAMAVAAKSVEPVLTLIWRRWAGLKHVWHASGWPFVQNPELNDGVVLGAGRLIVLQRRNLLRRYISGVISQQMRFWVGTREEFLARLENIQLRALDPATVCEEIKQDQIVMERRLQLIEANHIPAIQIFYEDLYGANTSPVEQFRLINRIVEFLGFSAVSESAFENQFLPLLDPDRNRWASLETYRRIPGIDAIECEAGSDETGWLFQ